MHTDSQTIELEDVKLEVKGAFYPLIRGCAYLRNGDPGYPDEGGYVEVEEVLVGGVNIYNILTREQVYNIGKLAYNAWCKKVDDWD